MTCLAHNSQTFQTFLSVPSYSILPFPWPPLSLSSIPICVSLSLSVSLTRFSSHYLSPSLSHTLSFSLSISLLLSVSHSLSLCGRSEEHTSELQSHLNL